MDLTASLGLNEVPGIFPHHYRIELATLIRTRDALVEFGSEIAKMVAADRLEVAVEHRGVEV